MYPCVVFQFLLLPKFLVTITASESACFSVSIKVCHQTAIVAKLIPTYLYVQTDEGCV